MIIKLIDRQFGPECAEFWANWPQYTPITPKTLSDWKRGFEKHGKFNTISRNVNKGKTIDGLRRWEKGTSFYN